MATENADRRRTSADRERQPGDQRRSRSARRHLVYRNGDQYNGFCTKIRITEYPVA